MPPGLDVLTSVPDVLGEGPVYDPSTGALFGSTSRRAPCGAST